MSYRVVPFPSALEYCGVVWAMSAAESAVWPLTAISCFCVLGSLKQSLLLLGLLPFVGGVTHRWLLITLVS